MFFKFAADKEKRHLFKDSYKSLSNLYLIDVAKLKHTKRGIKIQKKYFYFIGLMNDSFFNNSDIRFPLFAYFF